MHSRISSLACSILASAAFLAAPVRADSQYSTAEFQITFADGWQSMPTLVENDSGLALMYGYSMLGYCSVTASVSAQPLTQEEIGAFKKQYGGGDSLVKVAEGTDTLGGKLFSYTEYGNADTSNGDIRVRLYTTSMGTLQINSLLVYDFNSASSLVPQMDSALATLELSPTPIRKAAFRSPPARSAADHDILGRSRPVAMRSPLFRLPNP